MPGLGGLGVEFVAKLAAGMSLDGWTGGCAGLTGRTVSELAGAGEPVRSTGLVDGWSVDVSMVA